MAHMAQHGADGIYHISGLVLHIRLSEFAAELGLRLSGRKSSDGISRLLKCAAVPARPRVIPVVVSFLFLKGYNLTEGSASDSFIS
jgi:hypothetical protein